MNYLANLLMSGLAIGALYGLVAMAFATVFKVSRVLNFAQGEVMMLIAYISYTVSLYLPGGELLQAACVVVSAIVIGGLIERLIVRPMLGQPVFSVVMMTIALAVLIRALVALFWDTDPHRFPGSDMQAMVNVFGINITGPQMTLFAIFIALFIGIWLFLRGSMIGIAMRAAASDSTVTMLMGVSVSRIYLAAWVLSSLLAGVAGVLFANIYHIGPDIAGLGNRAFPAAIVGGLDSILGAAIGGLLIGVVENLAGGYIGSGAKEVAGFLVVLIVLMVRPYGLFGERHIERV